MPLFECWDEHNPDVRSAINTLAAKDAAELFVERRWEARESLDDAIEVLVRTPSGEVRSFTVDIEETVHCSARDNGVHDG